MKNNAMKNHGKPVVLHSPLVDDGLKHIDMHMHSDHSDDSITTYEESILIAKAFGIQSMSFTDHDSAGDFNVLQKIAAREGISLVRGIEISARILTRISGKQKRCHILGYDFNPDADEMRSLLGDVNKVRARTIEFAAQNLQNTYGWKVPEMDINKLVNEYPVLDILGEISDSIFYNPENLEIFIKSKTVHCIDDIFDVVLHSYSDARSATDFDSERVIWAINSSGGVPVIAHPVKSRLSKLDLWILAEMGAKGIEVFHPKHSEGQAMYLLRAARDMRLGITRGSDFHGVDKTDTEATESMSSKERNSVHRKYCGIMNAMSKRYKLPESELWGVNLANLQIYLRIHNRLDRQVNHSKEKTKEWKENPPKCVRPSNAHSLNHNNH